MNRHAWSRFMKITTPIFKSEGRWRFLGALAVLIALLLSLSGLNVLNSYVGRDFMTAVTNREVSTYYVLALRYVGVFAALTVLAGFYRFTEERLGLFWREWLTRHLIDRYLSGQAYYRINSRADLDNPDQRISEDVKTFAATTLSFALMVLNATITILAFSSVLWSITPWLFFAAVFYALFGSLGMVVLGRRLVGLDNLQLKKEADLRFQLVQVREHAEAITVEHGEWKERASLRRRLTAVVDNLKVIIHVNRNLSFFSNGYNYLTQIIPALIVAPLYVRGDIEFGVVTQAAMAFAHVLNAFSLIIMQFERISAFAAVITRLGSIWEGIEKASIPLEPAIRELGGPGIPVPESPMIRLPESPERAKYESPGQRPGWAVPSLPESPERAK